MKRIVPSIIFLMAFCHLSSAEYIDHRGHNIDSLQAVVNNNAKDSAYFNAVFNLASAYRQSDPHFALELSRILVNEYPNHGWPRLAAAGADNISIYYRAKGFRTARSCGR